MDTQVKVETAVVEHGDEIHLFVKQRDGFSATVAVRWCICPSIFNKLKKEHQPNPHILFVVTRDHTEVARKIVPLEQEMEYFYLQRPGQHRIQATVLCWKDASALRHTFLRKDGGDYKRTVVDYDGNLLAKVDRDDDPCFQIGRGEVGVEVAPEFFATKPPDWLWNWVNYWYETKPRDECQFRRRCILAFTLQPPVVLTWFFSLCLFRFLAALFLRFGVGMRSVSFTPAFHPFKEDTDDVWWYCKEDGGHSIFLVSSKGKRRSWFLAPFMPIVLLPLVGITLGIVYLVVPEFNIWSIIAGIVGGPAIIILAGYLVLFVNGYANSVLDRMADSAVEREKRREKLRQIDIDRKYDEAFGLLVCTGVPLEARLEALPRERRTLYLRFMDLKTKVCKPFAR